MDLNSVLWLVNSLLAGDRVRFQATGGSMQPFIQNYDILEVAPLVGKQITRGDVLLVETNEGRLFAHRVVKTGRRNGIPIYLTKGDSCSSPDGWIRRDDILGRVEVIERVNHRIDLTSSSQQLKAGLWVMIAPLVPKLSWLPEWLRQNVRHWLLVD